MIRTGIPGIDEMLGSGIPRGSRVIFSLETGVDGRPFFFRILRTVLSAGKNALIIAPQATERAFLSDFSQMMNTDPGMEPGKIVILDSSVRERINARLKGSRARRKEWQKTMRETIQENSIEVLFVYFDLLYEDFGLEPALQLLPSGDEYRGLTTIVEHLNLEGDSLISGFASGGYFDLIISVHSNITSVPFFNFFTLEYVSWSRMPRRSVPYTVTDRTIRLYIPKIIVTGPPSSGKSTFVANASDRGLSVDRGDVDGFKTTVAMDLGWLHLRGFDITLFGTPGQPRFDPILPQIIRNAMGMIMVIDATRPETLPRARDLLTLAYAARIPVVVAVNKVDLPHKMDERQVRESLKLRDAIPVFFISSLRRSDVHAVLESMIDHITRFSP
ncbi:MAG: GTP-binding protein [Methanolinea sp.]|jgi:small GTP-binding protein|nr:GTP-binding protein [Methanolinea sp.]